MKTYHIKYIDLVAKQNFASLNYMDCMMEGIDESDIRQKFKSKFKNDEILMSIEESK